MMKDQDLVKINVKKKNTQIFVLILIINLHFKNRPYWVAYLLVGLSAVGISFHPVVPHGTLPPLLKLSALADGTATLIPGKLCF